MKKLTLLACLLALTLGASAQNHQSVSPTAIPPNARGGEKANAVGATTIRPVAASQSADSAAKPAPDTGHKVPPIATMPPNAVREAPTAKK